MGEDLVGSTLPSVSISDSGKGLIVNSSGEWEVGDFTVETASGVTFYKAEEAGF